MLLKLLKVMKKISLFIFLILFCNLYAEEMEEEVKDEYYLRLDDGLYNKNYTGKKEKAKMKAKMVNFDEEKEKSKPKKKIVEEDDNDGEEDNDNDEHLYPKKSTYKGVYKVGKPYDVLGQHYEPFENENYDEKGMASWYGSDFHNKNTSNGEIYNMNDWTAAHRTLPMPSIVKVTNLENGKSVKVRINDRGPFVKDRIIDVSNRVAKELDFHNKGTTRIRVVYLKRESDLLLRKLGLHR
ncbi:MAG: septal ring lytic transglycosylase RlpA family protein [Rickettsiales bacterium]|jgi:rare lipoprotein A (peptidoglycan hydrolase)|nr:septal ring lytic transglycosylase RlpA family protein [Rickettsiales bacterium]